MEDVTRHAARPGAVAIQYRTLCAHGLQNVQQEVLHYLRDK